MALHWVSRIIEFGSSLLFFSCAQQFITCRYLEDTGASAVNVAKS